MSDTVLSRLREFEQLKGCTQQELEELAQHSSAIDVPAHWAFIIEGMPGDSCYVVLDGEVSVRQSGEEVAHLGSGSLVGEISLIEQRPRTATCVALTPLRLLEIEASEFNGWLLERPSLRDHLLASTTAVRQTPG
jgi:CRP/FNR family transcriptional regulator, cyclic AMP receptor protein